MIASKVIGNEILPYIITGVGARIAGSSAVDNINTRNPRSTGDITNNRGTVSLQPNN